MRKVFHNIKIKVKMNKKCNNINNIFDSNNNNNKDKINLKVNKRWKNKMYHNNPLNCN